MRPAALRHSLSSPHLTSLTRRYLLDLPDEEDKVAYMQALVSDQTKAAAFARTLHQRQREVAHASLEKIGFSLFFIFSLSSYSSQRREQQP